MTAEIETVVSGDGRGGAPVPGRILPGIAFSLEKASPRLRLIRRLFSKAFLSKLALAAWFACVGGPYANAESFAGRRPNVLFVLVDDLGYGDLSSHGNPILRTPNIDRLHEESVRFTDFHVSPTCAPTRSALFTGRHEFKNGVTHTILERERLTLDAITLAQVLQRGGYRTGIFGKWHLGDEAAYQPDRRGFDKVFIHGGGGIGQSFPGSCGDAPGNTYFNPAILHDGRFEQTRGYCTDIFFAQAMQWLESLPADRPFFCYLSLNAVHTPLQVRPEDEARYTGKVSDGKTAKYFGMVANVDDNVERLLAWLKARGLEERTLVIFMNDNGGTVGTHVFNAGMRGAKGSAWNGGTRATSFWRWPGTVKSADCNALAAHLDFFPTLADLAGVKLTEREMEQVEGRSLVPLLENPSMPWPDRTLFTHAGRWPKFNDPNLAKFKMCSVRTPRWHLVSPNGGAQPAWQLFDLKTDYGEQHDVAAQHSGIVQHLAAAFDGFWAEALPLMINENVVGLKQNPFAELYRKQTKTGNSP